MNPSHALTGSVWLTAESKRDLYNKGKASGYSRSGPTASSSGQQYYSAPRARSGWANYRYQQQKRPTSKDSVSRSVGSCNMQTDAL